MKMLNNIWNKYKSWLGNTIWYKNWKFWLTVVIIIILGTIGDFQNQEEEQRVAKEQIVMQKKSEKEQEKREVIEQKNIKKQKEEQKQKEEEKEKKKAEAKAKEDAEYQYELIDDIAVFTNDKSIVLGINQHLESFSYDMTQALKKKHGEIKNGAIFRNITPLVDKFGNEEKTTTVVVYYSQDTIEAINYDNWPTIDSSGLYDTADATWVHYALKESKVKNNTSIDSERLPSLYFSMQGATYE